MPALAEKFEIQAQNSAAQKAPAAAINPTFYLIIPSGLAVRNAKKCCVHPLFFGENTASATFAIFRIIDPGTPPATPMSLTLNDIARLSRLAQLELSEQQASDALAKLNDIFALVEQMRAVDTTGIEPLAHPVAAWQDELAMRLRDDQVTEPNRRDDYQQPAPLVQDGLYLVPKVIE